MAVQPTSEEMNDSPMVPPSLDPRHLLIELVSEVVTIIDADGIITYCSPSITSQLGWETGEILGQPIADFMALEHHEDFDDVFAAVAAAPGTHGPFGLNLRTKDGRVRQMESIVTNRISDPVIGGLVTVARDSTERVAADDARLRAEARYRALVQFSSDLVVLVDVDGLVTYASPSVERILGIPHEAQGIVVFDLIHPDDIEVARESLQLAVEDPGALDGVPFEFRVLATDGTYRNLEILGSNLVDDPDVGGIVLNARDVTERVVAGARAAEQAAVLPWRRSGCHLGPYRRDGGTTRGRRGGLGGDHGSRRRDPTSSQRRLRTRGRPGAERAPGGQRAGRGHSGNRAGDLHRHHNRPPLGPARGGHRRRVPGLLVFPDDRRLGKRSARDAHGDGRRGPFTDAR